MISRKITALSLGIGLLLIGCTPDEVPEPTDNRDTYTGTWTLKETSTVFGSTTYQVTLKKGSGSNELMIQNFYNLGFDQQLRTTLAGSSITIPGQTLNGHQVQGSGSASNDNQIQLQYVVNDGSGDDDATALLTR